MCDNSKSSRSDSDSSDLNKYELVPPEGGWGYLVCVGLSLIFVSSNINIIKFIYK